jgi:hypothetical protein
MLKVYTRSAKHITDSVFVIKTLIIINVFALQQSLFSILFLMLYTYYRFRYVVKWEQKIVKLFNIEHPNDIVLTVHRIRPRWTKVWERRSQNTVRPIWCTLRGSYTYRWWLSITAWYVHVKSIKYIIHRLKDK